LVANRIESRRDATSSWSVDTEPDPQWRFWQVSGVDDRCGGLSRVVVTRLIG